MTGRPLCPHGCVDRYLPAAITTDGELLEQRPCPHCQATRIAAFAEARDVLGPEAIAAARRRFGDPVTGRRETPEPIAPDVRAARLRANARRRGALIPEPEETQTR